ncbi:MAG: hypothetical protein ACTSRZ_13645 [Promethearchaeota archaeon]
MLKIIYILGAEGINNFKKSNPNSDDEIECGDKDEKLPQNFDNPDFNLNELKKLHPSRIYVFSISFIIFFIPTFILTFLIAKFFQSFLVKNNIEVFNLLNASILTASIFAYINSYYAKYVLLKFQMKTLKELNFKWIFRIKEKLNEINYEFSNKINGIEVWRSKSNKLINLLNKKPIFLKIEKKHGFIIIYGPELWVSKFEEPQFWRNYNI